MKRVWVNLDKIAARQGGVAGPRAERTDLVELLQARVGILAGRDKALMQMYLTNGSTFNQMARLAGVSEWTIARRIHKLIRKLLGGEYITCLRNRGQLDSLEQAIAKDYFLEELSQRIIAAKRNVTIYRVRKAVKKMRSLANSG